jgi:uncharacterized protein (TIGR02452 family)
MTSKQSRTKIVTENNQLLITKRITIPKTIKVDYVDKTYPLSPPTSDTQISVVDMYTDQCAKFVLDGVDSKNVVIMNFASRHNCGGGYLNGARAQEEDLCRVIPALYSSLKQIRYPFPKHSILITPNIEIWRDNYYNVLRSPYTISVVSAAAQNLKYESFDYRLVENILTSIFVNVKDTLPNTDTLILGAWGCGVYGNSPEIMANLMNSVITKYGGLYKKIIFAIPSGQNYDTFKSIIKPS